MMMNFVLQGLLLQFCCCGVRTQEIPSGEEHRRTTQANEWNRDQFNRNPLQGPLLVDLGRDTTKGSVVCL